MSTKFDRAYRVLVQKAQAGIKTLAERCGQSKLYDAKHLRVGVNNCLVEQSAMARLLMKKGVITEEEYEASLIIAHEEEVARLEQELLERTGLHIKLDVPPDFE